MLLETYLWLVTSLGNVVVVGALALAVAFYLLSAGSRNSAVSLAVVFVAAACAIGIVKLLCMSCHINPLDHNLQSPSGHVCMSTAVYCTVASIITANMKRWPRVGTWFCVLFMLFTIGISRILLGLHSPDEVVAGSVVGGVIYGLVRIFVLRPVPVKINGRALALTMIVLVVVLHGVNISLEPMIAWVADHMREHISVC